MSRRSALVHDASPVSETPPRAAAPVAPARPARTALAVLAFVAVATALTYRASTKLAPVGHPDEQHWAITDFRDQVYFPVRSLLEGHNPFDRATYMATYPVMRPLAMYSPLSLLLHLPFGLLPVRVAEAAYFLLTLCLTLALAYCSLRLAGAPTTVAGVSTLATVILLSRPGQWNLLLGQLALQASLATYLALHCARERPWLAGAALAASTFKPTFGVPVALLMLALGGRRAVVIGAALAGTATLAITTVLVHLSGGPAAFLSSVAGDYLMWSADPAVNPVWSPFRIDGVALASHIFGWPVPVAGQLAIAAAVLGIAAGLLRLLAAPGRDHGPYLTMTVACLGVLTCVYHLGYDLLLLTMPIIAVATTLRRPSSRRLASQWILLGLLLLPMANYLASGTAIEYLQLTGGMRRTVISLNGAALLAALSVCAGQIWRRRP